MILPNAVGRIQAPGSMYCNTMTREVPRPRDIIRPFSLSVRTSWPFERKNAQGSENTPKLLRSGAGQPSRLAGLKGCYSSGYARQATLPPSFPELALSGNGKSPKDRYHLVAPPGPGRVRRSGESARFAACQANFTRANLSSLASQSAFKRRLLAQPTFRYTHATNP